jgi:hypothetical protein
MVVVEIKVYELQKEKVKKKWMMMMKRRCQVVKKYWEKRVAANL